MQSKVQSILSELKKLGNEKDRQGMGRFGINIQNAYGVSVYVLREIAKKYKKNHQLALDLWKTGIHEAQLLACFVEDTTVVTEKQIESWLKDFDSWDVCDLCCSNVFDKTAFAYAKAVAWTKRKEEFVKRAGFVLMAALSVHDKKADDSVFITFLPIIKRESTDERNFVRKAVNWAIRQIGKRNLNLNKKAIAISKEIQKIDSKTAKWIANDALRELTAEKMQQRLKEKSSKQ